MTAPGGFVTKRGPSVSVTFNASLPFLGTYGIDVSQVISDVKMVVAEFFAMASPDAAIEPSTIATSVAMCAGVASVGTILIDGSADAFTGPGGEPYNLYPNDVDVVCGIVDA